MLVTAAISTTLALVSPGCGDPPESPSQGAPSEREAAPGRATVVGKAPPATSGFPSIIVLEPRTPSDFPAAAEPPVMDQFGLAFLPAMLLARTGEPVLFRNSEDVLHNVRVVESETKLPVFNVAIPPFGSYTHTFERPGFYTVACDVHPAMKADILVTSSPYATTADKAGDFTLPDVPPGEYTLVVYHGTQRLARDVNIAAPRTELIVTGN